LDVGIELLEKIHKMIHANDFNVDLLDVSIEMMDFIIICFDLNLIAIKFN
jgi:hypothetical protein